MHPENSRELCQTLRVLENPTAVIKPTSEGVEVQAAGSNGRDVENKLNEENKKLNLSQQCKTPSET